jgi:hypothetical protein
MTRNQKLRRFVCGGVLLLICLAQSGCTEFIATNVGENLDYNQRYDNAKSAGLSDHEADRRAFEGQYFQDPY